MTHLYDNAITAQSDLCLAVGIELTQAQIDALKEDIIWLVEKEVNGHTVLVPEVYLSKLNRENLDKNTGSIIKTGNNISITAENDITNSGTITGSNDVTLTSNNGGIENNKGNLESGNNLTLSEKEDIKNISGTISSENNINITSTDGNFLNETKKYNISGDNQGISKGIFGYKTNEEELFNMEWLGSTATVSSKNGNLNINANSVTSKGGNISAKEDVILTARSGNVNIEAQSTTNSSKLIQHNRRFIESEVKNYASSVSGKNVNITSTQNTNIIGSNIDSQNNINIVSGNNTNIASAKDSYNKEYYHKKKKSWGRKTEITEKASRTNQVSSNVTSKNNINIVSGNNTNLVSSKTQSENLNIQTNTLNLIANKNTDFYSYKKDKNGLVTMSMKDKGHIKENLVYNDIDANNFNVNVTGKVNATVTSKEKQFNNLIKATDILNSEIDDSQIKPLLTAMGLSDKASYNPILLQNDEWDISYSGLNEVGMIAVAIAASALMTGIGTGIAGAMATAGTVTATAIGSISIINAGLNGADPLKAIYEGQKSVISEDGMKSVATSMAIAGLAMWAKMGIEGMTNKSHDLHSGSYDNSNVGVNTVKGSDGKWYLGKIDRSGKSVPNIDKHVNMNSYNRWGGFGSPYTNNPALKTANTIPGFEPFADFHDVSMTKLKITSGAGKFATIFPWLPVSYCTSDPTLCSTIINDDVYDKNNDLYK